MTRRQRVNRLFPGVLAGPAFLAGAYVVLGLGAALLVLGVLLIVLDLCWEGTRR